MKTIAIPVTDPLKAKLDVLRRKGLTIHGYLRSLLNRELAEPHVLTAEHLTKKQIERIEDAINTDDLKVMVMIVDAVIGQRRPNTVQKGRRSS